MQGIQLQRLRKNHFRTR
ncbi:hypothetical protein ABFV49_27905 [Pseudomonas lurida]